MLASLCCLFAGSSLVFYAFTGFFGAALFGAGTQGNVMLNNLAGSSKLGCIVLYGAMLLYLAAGAAACQYPLRTSLDSMLVGDHVPMTKARSVRCVYAVVALWMSCMCWHMVRWRFAWWLHSSLVAVQVSHGYALQYGTQGHGHMRCM